MVESIHSIKIMLNIAVALVLAFVIICSIILIQFGQYIWPPIGGRIALVVVMYSYLRFSSARFYLRPDIKIHIMLLCSYLLIGVPVWRFKFNQISPGLPALLDIPLMVVIMMSGITLLGVGLIRLFVKSKSGK